MVECRARMSEAGLSLETATSRIGLVMEWDLVVLVMRDWMEERALVRVSMRCGVGEGSFMVSVVVDIVEGGRWKLIMSWWWNRYNIFTNEVDVDMSGNASNDVNFEFKKREDSPMQMRIGHADKLNASSLDLPFLFNLVYIVQMEIPAMHNDQIGVCDVIMDGLGHYAAEKVGDDHTVDTQFGRLHGWLSEAPRWTGGGS